MASSCRARPFAYCRMIAQNGDGYFVSFADVVESGERFSVLRKFGKVKCSQLRRSLV